MENGPDYLFVDPWAKISGTYETKVHGVDELKHRKLDVWRCSEQSAIDDTMNEWRKNVSVRVFMPKDDF